MTCSENAFKVFSRLGVNENLPTPEKCLFPHLLPQDVIEISGEAGSGKTELLYNFISTSILPSTWKGNQIGGLGIEVTFIDNDCHFNLFRLVSIMENRVKKLIRESHISCNKKEIFPFIQDTLKSLNIIKCYDSNEFIFSLSSLESTLCLKRRKTIIMIDGLSSFYYADRAVFQNNFSKLASHYKVIKNLLTQISKKFTPIIATRRKLSNAADSDKKVVNQLFNNISTWKFELEYKSSLPDKTLLVMLNLKNSLTRLCYINNFGFTILEESKKVS